MHRHRCTRRWAHDYDPDRSIAATFQSLPGASFVVNGAAQAATRSHCFGRNQMDERPFGVGLCVPITLSELMT